MLSALGFGFSESRCKPYLKMASKRIQIVCEKKTNMIKTQKREIARLLSEGKEEKARIRAEHIIREDFTIEAYEIIALLCDLISERIRYIASEEKCPADLVESVSTLIWCSNKTEIAELEEVKRQFIHKYETPFIEAAMTNQGNCVNGRIIHKLSVAPPSSELVISYLKEIASEHNLDWTPSDENLPSNIAGNVMPSPDGFSIPMAPGSNLTASYTQPSEFRYDANGLLVLQPSLASTSASLAHNNNIIPSVMPQETIKVLPPVASVPSVAQDDGMSFEDLEARFQALSKK